MSKVVLKIGDLLIVSPDRFDSFVATLVETTYRGPEHLSPHVVVQRAGVNDWKGGKYPAMTSVVEVRQLPKHAVSDETRRYVAQKYPGWALAVDLVSETEAGAPVYKRVRGKKGAA